MEHGIHRGILVFTEIESHWLFYYMTLNQIWINTKQRRLCSPDTPVCPTSAIINLIVYRKQLQKNVHCSKNASD